MEVEDIKRSKVPLDLIQKTQKIKGNFQMLREMLRRFLIFLEKDSRRTISRQARRDKQYDKILFKVNRIEGLCGEFIDEAFGRYDRQIHSLKNDLDILQNHLDHMSLGE